MYSLQIEGKLRFYDSSITSVTVLQSDHVMSLFMINTLNPNFF